MCNTFPTKPPPERRHLDPHAPDIERSVEIRGSSFMHWIENTVRIFKLNVGEKYLSTFLTENVFQRRRL